MGYDNELKNVILGLDIGKKTDFTVLTVVERWQKYGYDLFAGKNKVGKPFYHLVHLDRLPLDTPHTTQITHVAEAMQRVENHYKKNPNLVIDVGSVGESHFDSYKELGLKVYGVAIHGGRDVTYTNKIYSVPKVDLTSTLAVLLENNRLLIAEDLPGREVLVKELMTFSWKQTDTGHFKFEHLKSGDHDDTVLSLQVACWFGEKGIREAEAVKLPPPGVTF